MNDELEVEIPTTADLDELRLSYEEVEQSEKCLRERKHYLEWAVDNLAKAKKRHQAAITKVLPYFLSALKKSEEAK